MKGFVTVTSLCFLAFSLAAPDQLGHHKHSRHAHSPPQNGYRLPPPPPQPPTYVPPTRASPPTYLPPTTAPPPPPPRPTYLHPTKAPPPPPPRPTYLHPTTAPPPPPPRPTYLHPTKASPPPPPRPTYLHPTKAPPPPPPPPTYQRPTTTPSYPAYIYGPPVTTTEKPKYWFEWDVNDHYSGNEYSMQEHRDGEKTEGFYTVLLPDTRVQKVTYTIDGDSGFVAEVTYEGEAKEHENKHEYLLPSPPTPHTPIYGVPHPSG